MTTYSSNYPREGANELLNLRQLQTFEIVAEELHFTRAAERLGIAQPTLSLQIQSLEESVGLPLFDRTGKRIRLTQAGVVLLKYAKQVIQSVNSAASELDDLRNLHTGSLTIGMLSGDLDFRLTSVLCEFRLAFPDIRLSLFGPVNVREMVLQNQADIGLTVVSDADDRLVQIPIIHETFGVVTNHEHPLSKRTQVSFSELSEVEFIMFPKGFVGRDLIDSYGESLQIRLEPVVETSTVPSVIHLVRNGAGAAILSKQLVESIRHDDLRFIPIVHPTPVRDIGVMYRTDRYLSHAARTFIQKITAHFDGLS